MHRMHSMCGQSCWNDYISQEACHVYVIEQVVRTSNNGVKKVAWVYGCREKEEALLSC